MEQEKNVTRHVIVAMSGIRLPGEMHEPFAGGELPEKPRVPPLQPEMPWSGDEKENQNPIPAQQFTKSKARFTIENGEQTQDCGRVEKPVQAFRHAGERDKNPKANEPSSASPPPFVAADRTIKGAGNQGAEDRLGHDHATENKRATTTEMNESGNETAPRTTQAVANQESERDGSDRREGDGQAHRRGREAKSLERNDNCPIEKERFLETRNAVVRGREPLMRLKHLARGAGILSIGLVIKIPPADRREMEQSRQAEKKNEARVGPGAVRV